MSYQSFLISNYKTGYDNEVQPWLLPNDAFVELFDGFVYRGVTQKREGYSGYATGVTSIPTESRMVHRITASPMTGTINGSNKIFTLTAAHPVRRGTVTINGSNPVQVLVDDGEGTFTGNGTGTINYTTGAISITFTTAPAGASTVTATYDVHQGLPVMGVMNFYPTNNVRQLIVVDTVYVNRYNPTTDRLDDISTTTYNGLFQDFWSWVNYPDASSNPRLLFCNGVNGDVIQQYDGSTIIDYAPLFASGTTLNARQMFQVRGRLVLFQTIEGGTLFPRRIRISGFGANCDVFDQTDGAGKFVPGSGFIDIPDNTWFFGAAFNRDDVLVYTEAATWLLKYTGNDTTPFVLEKLDVSRGSSAAFSVLSYLNRTIAASPRGLIITDGYQVERMDNNIPDFTFNSIDNDQFTSCFSGFVDEDRDVYLIYPSEGVLSPPLLPAGYSDRILTINFEEDNYAIYRLPLSCMGNFQESIAILWSDLTPENGYPNWDSLAAKYSNWNAFPFKKGAPVSIGGGHYGEIWQLGQTGLQDNPQKIRNITSVDSNTLQITTDWNNYDLGDYINFEAIGGMIQLNDKQAAVISTPTPHTVFNVQINNTGFSNYTSGGIASKSIHFEALTKKLNPFINLDKKLKCGWIYFYVGTTSTNLMDANGNPETPYLFIDVITDDTNVNTVPTYRYKVDLSERPGDLSDKRWVKIWINQTAKFLQFRMSNNQAGASIKVHAMMPGLMPLGRLV